MIRSPGIRPCRPRRRRPLVAALQLTALVDVLVVLTIYALLDYGGPSGELLT
jgi:hypothetical protein